MVSRAYFPTLHGNLRRFSYYLQTEEIGLYNCHNLNRVFTRVPVHKHVFTGVSKNLSKFSLE